MPNLKISARFAPGGFTVIELMVVVAIVAILASIGVPSFSSMMQKNRLSAAASALQVSLSLARSEAIKRGVDTKVTVAPNVTASTWTNGWTVFLDKTTDANGGIAPTADSASVTRIEVVSAPAAPVSVGASPPAYFMYNGQGRVQSATGGPGNGVLWFFDGASERYCLIVSTSGRVRTERSASATACPTN